MVESPRRYLPPARELRLSDGRTVTIRPTVPDDAPALIACLKQVGSESTFVTFGAEGFGLDEPEQRAAIAQLHAADNALGLVAAEGDRLVGSLTFMGGTRSRIRHTGELGLGIRREFTGQGVGRAMLETLIHWAERSGVVRKLDLRVVVENVGAIRLYEKLGWRQEGRISRDMVVDGVFHDVLYMGRPVDP
jgi:RimJ/RimL family protein N-acetyltransferase